jgi:hypothetical protein
MPSVGSGTRYEALNLLQIEQRLRILPCNVIPAQIVNHIFSGYKTQESMKVNTLYFDQFRTEQLGFLNLSI